MLEKWLWIYGYKGIYMVSNLGRIKSFKRKNEIYIKVAYNSHGYGYVCLYNNGPKHYRIHRLVADAFIPNPDNKRCVNHKNGIKTDNRVENLEWCTHKENTKHAIDTGLAFDGCNLNGNRLKGGSHKDSRFTKEDVIYIRSIYKENDLTQSDIAKKFNVAQSTIERIVNYKNWKHV